MHNRMLLLPKCQPHLHAVHPILTKLWKQKKMPLQNSRNQIIAVHLEISLLKFWLSYFCLCFKLQFILLNTLTVTNNQCMRVICKVCRLTLLLQVRTLWRCGDDLFFEVPPLTNDTLLTTLHPLLENVCRPLITSKVLASELPLHGLKSPEIAWGRIQIEFCV